MTADRWNRIDRIFQDVLQKEPTERQRFLEQACGDYDVHPLTGEFVILVPATPQTSPTLPPPQTIRTVLNWFDDVREAQ